MNSGRAHQPKKLVSVFLKWSYIKAEVGKEMAALWMG